MRWMFQLTFRDRNGRFTRAGLFRVVTAWLLIAAFIVLMLFIAAVVSGALPR